MPSPARTPPPCSRRAAADHLYFALRPRRPVTPCGRCHLLDYYQRRRRRQQRREHRSAVSPPLRRESRRARAPRRADSYCLASLARRVAQKCEPDDRRASAVNPAILDLTVSLTAALRRRCSPRANNKTFAVISRRLLNHRTPSSFKEQFCSIDSNLHQRRELRAELACHQQCVRAPPAT